MRNVRGVDARTWIARNARVYRERMRQMLVERRVYNRTCRAWMAEVKAQCLLT